MMEHENDKATINDLLIFFLFMIPENVLYHGYFALINIAAGNIYGGADSGVTKLFFDCISILVGNMASFEQIYESYFNRIYKFVFRLTGQAEDAKDLTQDTFIKLNNHFSSFLNHENPKAWVYKVAANTCLNHLKRKEKYRMILNQVGKETSPVKSTEEEFIKKEKQNMLRKELNRLPPRDQIILGLYKEGLSYTDMARVINVKKSSVGKILSRAIKKLAQQISKEN